MIITKTTLFLGKLKNLLLCTKIITFVLSFVKQIL